MIGELLPVQNGLQGLWHLEADGADSGPNGYTLTGSGTPVHILGKFANGVDLEASSSQYYSRASAANCNTTGSQTWMAWIKPESLVTGIIAGFDSGSDPGRKFYSETDGTIVTFISGVTGQAITPALIVAGNWHHVVFRYDATGNTLAAFVNGRKTEVTTSGTADATAAALAVGADFRGGSDAASNFFDGVIDEVAMFNRALSDREVLDYYAWALGGRSSVI